MPRLAAGLNRVRHSFGAKLLLALAGTIALLILVTLLTVRAQTRRQLAVALQRSVQQSRRVFDQQERDVREGLANDVDRWTQSNRIPAAFGGALESGTVDVLVEAISYEIRLARRPDALTLHAYTDPGGAPMGSALGPRVLRDGATGVPAPLVNWLLSSDTATAQFGYHLVDGRLFAVYTTLVADPFGTVLGTMTLGTPVTDSLARAAGEAIGAEVCYVARGRCAASTQAGRRGMEGVMVGMAGVGQPRRVTWRGRRFLLRADRVSAGAGMQDVWRVVAFPLDGVLGPFESIQRAAVLAGLGALVLAGLLSLLLARGFARPVRALVAATERVAAGDYDVRVEATSRDELGTLAGAFNEMTHGLMLKERYRGVLDKVVSRDIADELLKGEIMLGGETRRVTTLFADIRGFTAMTEGMEPQRVIALLNEFMERASDAVQAEGGVVDKFVGDEVMGVFGAPVSRGDDANRAVRAALRIRREVDVLNRQRAARGEPVLGVGIGINSGAAVAGNMGSPGRLNYTVLGESVNVASRLCDQAAAGQILVLEPFLAELRTGVDAQALGPRTFKGISAPLQVYTVRGLPETPAGDESPADVAASTDAEPSGDAASAAPAKPASAAATATGILLAAGLALGGATEGAAQNLPTFEELGIAWSSPRGFLQVTPSGRIEVEGYAPGDVPRGLVRETDPFANLRASLFVDVFAGQRVYGTVELRADRGEAAGDRPLRGRIEQAYLRVTPWTAVNLSLQAGKFVSPFGGWPQRHASLAQEAFIQPPLPYDYRTVVSTTAIPGGAAGFLTWKNRPDEFRAIGAPPVWAAPYQVGAMVAGGWKALTARAAVMNSAPSSEPGEWHSIGAGEHGPSYIAHLGVKVLPELRVGVSYNRGSYLEDETTLSPLPAGEDVSHYKQRMWGFEASFARGPLEARGELLVDSWDVPNVAEYPRDVSFYLESKVKLTPGLFAAARYSGIRFDRIDNGSGTQELWDYPVDRLQLAAGYRLGRSTEIRGEYMLNWTDAPPVGRDDLFAARWTWSF
ncbi:MAG TPA: adenylate/guanylate cyclase domain-containing protein [Longimicrobium sp.]|nr:adenylate/guanylate cyclase domain-containing protein [Longimicrobium sp.]